MDQTLMERGGGRGSQTVNLIIAEISGGRFLREPPHLITNEAMDAIRADEYISAEELSLTTIINGDVHAGGVFINIYDPCA